MSTKFIDASLSATAPSAHSGFSKGSIGLYVIMMIIETSVCDKNHSLTIKSQVVVMAQWDYCAQVRVRLNN